MKIIFNFFYAAEISKMFRKKRKKRCEKERDIELIMAERDIYQLKLSPDSVSDSLLLNLIL